jgi:ankyrin repeat protein
LTDSDFQEAIARHTTPENIEFIVSEVKRFMNDWPSHFKSIFALCSRNMIFLKFLVETVGFDANTKDRLGNTLLSSIPASVKNSFEVAEYLIQKGADVNTQDVFGDTPLLTAVRSTSMTREQYRFRQLSLKHGASSVSKTMSEWHQLT